MNPLQRFLEYAAAFELSYADDDWTRLEPFFAPDAIYRVTGSNAWDCEVKGCKALLAAMRKFVDEFDRLGFERIFNRKGMKPVIFLKLLKLVFRRLEQSDPGRVGDLFHLDVPGNGELHSGLRGPVQGDDMGYRSRPIL
jgi:hypothetical protein